MELDRKIFSFPVALLFLLLAKQPHYSKSPTSICIYEIVHHKSPKTRIIFRRSHVNLLTTSTVEFLAKGGTYKFPTSRVNLQYFYTGTSTAFNPAMNRNINATTTSYTIPNIFLVSDNKSPTQLPRENHNPTQQSPLKPSIPFSPTSQGTSPTPTRTITRRSLITIHSTELVHHNKIPKQHMYTS